MILILHNIRSVHNVGSIFRTADAAGVERIILSGYTPTPIDRFGRVRGDFTKVSLGAEKTVPWMHIPALSPAIARLRKEGVCIAALEQDRRSTSLFDFRPPVQPLALILGNEVRGLSSALRARCDALLEIPMYGSKESLNVAVAAGIALYTLMKKP